jgi:hypothetical protein
VLIPPVGFRPRPVVGERGVVWRIGLDQGRFADVDDPRDKAGPNALRHGRRDPLQVLCLMQGDEVG